MTKRLTWELNDEAYKILEDLAKANHKTKSEILREGLGLRWLADSKKGEGKSLGVVRADNTVETTILLA